MAKMSGIYYNVVKKSELFCMKRKTKHLSMYVFNLIECSCHKNTYCDICIIN
jgi:hypothetical protein